MKEIPSGFKLQRTDAFTIKKNQNPSSSGYLKLYKDVGEKWSWYNRFFMNEKELNEIIHHPLVDIYYIYHHEKLIGFAELDKRIRKETELVYFGLLPEFHGKGTGRYFLNQIIYIVFAEKPERFWLHTCELDHPKALKFYQQAGFTIYRDSIETQIIPFKGP